MSNDPHNPNPPHDPKHDPGKSRPDEAALIDSYVAFARFAVQTVARGYEAVIAANTTLALGGIEALSHTAQAWTHVSCRTGLIPEPGHAGETKTTDFANLWDANLEVSRKWTTEVTRAWSQAASAYVKALEPTNK